MPVTVTLTATAESGAGIERIEYSKNGVDWTSYTAPFSYAEEGATMLFYRAVDSEFNLEDPNAAEFKIDTRQPHASVTPSTVGTQLSLAFTLSDPVPGSGGSGLFTISRVGSSSTTVTTFTPLGSSPALLNTLCTDLEYWAKDVAGNQEAPRQRLTDTKPPVLTVPPNVTVTTCNPTTLVQIGTATATDDCTVPTVSGAVIATNGVTLPTPIPVVSGKATLGVGTHTVRWTATDGINPSAPLNQTVVVGTRLQATQSFMVEDRAIVQNTSGAFMPIYNSGSGLALLGNDARAGSVLSVGQIKVLHRAVVNGDATSSSTVFKEPDGSVTGTIRQFASVSIPGLPALPSFPNPTGGNITVNSGSQSPAPGSYGTAQVNGGTLILGAGDYYFRSLTINANVTVRATPTTRVFVRDTLAIKSPFRASTGTTVQSIYLGFAGSALSVEATFSGTVLAPNATVLLGTDTSLTFTGAFYARTIDLRPANVIKCQ